MSFKPEVLQKARVYPRESQIWAYAAAAAHPWSRVFLGQEERDILRSCGAYSDVCAGDSEYCDHGLRSLVQRQLYSGEWPIQWIVALPGCGKTTFAMHTPTVIDVDYGKWRRHGRRSRAEMAADEYAQQLADFMNYVAVSVAKFKAANEFEYVTILVNELDLIPFIQALGHPLILAYPHKDFIADWQKGLIARASRPNASMEGREFVNRALDAIYSWRKDWHAAALYYGVDAVELHTWIDKTVIERLTAWSLRGQIGTCCGCAAHPRSGDKNGSL